MFARKSHTVTHLPAPVPVPADEAGHDALRFLTGQGLEHNPVNYALAWRTRMDRRGLAAMAVDAILMDGRTVTPGDVERILKAEAERASSSTRDPEHDALRHQARRLAELTADAVIQSRDFGTDLSSDLVQLDGGADATRTVVETMVRRTRGVEAQLRDASRQIEELRQQVDASRDDAQRDALTGLLNRRGATHALAARQRRRAGAIGMCDVDHFKSVNDRFGHGVGDRVLKGVAASLAESLRPHLVARWGGEEFLVVFDGIEPPAAFALLERARRDLEARTFRLRESDAPLGAVTVSAGLADLAGRDPADAIEAADRMLYRAKQEGRNRVALAAAKT